MGLDNIGRNVIAVIVMLILMAMTVKYTVEENTGWQNISAQGLNTKIQMGITQIYWQWQQQGRAHKIEYSPENVKKAFVINMTNKGLPELEKSKEGCNEFLSWFVEEKVLSNQIEVTTSYIERKVTNQAPNDGTKDHTEADYVCQYMYANKFLEYDLKSGQLTFTD